MTVKYFYDLGVITDETVIYIHIEDSKIDSEFTVYGHWFNDNILTYIEVEADSMRMYKESPNKIYFNIYL